MKINVLSLLLAVMLPAGKARAQSLPPAWERIKLSDSLQSIKFSGDLRLRNDTSKKRGSGTVDRGRNRYRLRLGAELQMPDDITAVFRLASGTGEQVSTNQSYSALGSQKGIFIDQAYAKWSPALGDQGSFYVSGGRMQNFLWRAYSSDIIWDDDFNPEGFSQGAEWLIPGAGLTLFANGLQMVANEGSSSGKMPWLFSQQVGFEKRLPLETRLKLAGAYHKWSDENRTSFGQGVVQDGNRRTSRVNTGLLLNRFGTAEVTGQLSGWAGKLPMALQATVARNMRARGDLAGVAAACPAGQTCNPARDGYQYGVIVGAAKAAHTWEAAYFKKYSQTDVTMADLSDSDFGDGGTNRKGHIFWLAYAPRDWMQFKAKAFITETIDTQYDPGIAIAGGFDNKAVNRLQIDWSIKF